MISQQISMTMIPTLPDGGQVEANQGRSMLVQWFPQWCGWYKTTPSTGTAPSSTPPTSSATPSDSTTPSTPLLSPSHQLPPTSSSSSSLLLLTTEPAKDQTQLEDEILNALAGSVENNSLLKRDAVFGKFNFILKKGTLDVCTGSAAQIPLNQVVASKLMLQLQFENLLLTIESRPRSASHFVGLSLGSIFVKDHITVDSEFPDLIRPQLKDEPAAPLVSHSRLQRVSRFGMGTTPPVPPVAAAEPLFQMNYERKPLTYNTDYRLQIKSQSLDIVYNVDAINWIVDFVMKPHQVMSARRKIEAMKNKTKMELIKSWEQVLEGDLSERKSWSLEIDISAPQIIFAENFHMKNGSIVVIDFGRLQLNNSNSGANEEPSFDEGHHGQQKTKSAAATDLMLMHRDSEDEEAFMTPCSTPPGSECSTTDDSPTLCSALSDPMALSEMLVVNPGDAGLLNEKSLHHKLYDSYSMNLTDMQVLVCKSKERWSFASAKGSSTLHLLDRFSISLQFERRVVFTLDPQYPSLTMSGSLPKLVAHVNEHKIAAITQMLNTLSVASGAGAAGQSPQKVLPFEDTPYEQSSETTSSSSMPDVTIGGGGGGGGVGESGNEEDQQREASKMIILQFSIDQMALEVQSRGRSIAELQVTGVKAGYSKRVEDTSFTLSVHGLLLVDAIQSFGPDFELLIASHRHVGYIQFF